MVCGELGVRCRICVIRNKTGSGYQICVVRSESSVCYGIVLSIANQVFCVELCCPQRFRFSAEFVVLSNSGVRCQICIVRCRIVLFIVKQVLATKLCSPQQIRCSLPNRVVRYESGVGRRVVLSTTNQVLLPNLCCL